MIRDEVVQWIAAGLAHARSAGVLPELDAAITVERPRQTGHGDYASNLALQAARSVGLSPRQIADALVRYLPQEEFAGRAEVAGPGFINVRLDASRLYQEVGNILASPSDWVRLDLGAGQSFLLEFVSANPTGPLHVGRTWGAVLGDTLARLFEAVGYKVTREYYFNNAGRQMRLLGQSTQARYLTLLGRPQGLPDDGYQGEYVREIAQTLVAEAGAAYAAQDWPFFAARAEAWLVNDIQATLQRLGVRFDQWFNEQELIASGQLDEVLTGLSERGLIYENEGATWLRATALGGEKDRVLVRATGEPTYRLPDIAYHLSKLRRGFDHSLTVLGVDHQHEFPDVSRAVTALGYDASRLEVLIHQFVSLVRDGQPVRMSTRHADYITLDELLDLVTTTHPETGVTLPGRDPVRFLLLMRAPSSPMAFDIEQAVRQNSDNPVYYVQYAHARLASLRQKAEAEGWTGWRSADLALLVQSVELDLVRTMAELPEVIEQAVHERAPHHLVTYASSLASAVHTFYRDSRVLSPVPAERQLSLARLKLVVAAQIVLTQTLSLLGVSAPERM
ncbi:MAG: arginine--tRNA ligase [Anaerolineales bacterium]|nr:arginine--tRNA ligase [Anaerolineales bacterium]